MKTLEDLLNQDEPGITLIREWVEAAENDCKLLPPSDKREQVLLDVQVTTRSTMGAIAYETGGVLIDHGWLRFPGSGHPQLPRTLPDWNRGRSDGLYLIADDAVGGFFAINGGALGNNIQNVYYWPPDSLDWESLKMGYTDFFSWSLTSQLADFYADLRWPSWTNDVAELPGDCCFNFFPFLWTKEGSVEGSDRRPVPIHEAFDLKVDLLRQIGKG